MKNTILKLLPIILMAMLILVIPGKGRAQHQCLNIRDNAYIVLSGGDTPATPIYLVVDHRYPEAILSTGKGWIISEANYNCVKWNFGSSGVAGDSYVIPFGYGTTYYLPVTLETTTKTSDVTAATFATNAANTNPDPYPTPPITDVGSIWGGTYINDIIDRFWRLKFTNSPANFANITFFYRLAENTLSNPKDDDLLPQQWVSSTTPEGWSWTYNGGTWPGQWDPGDPNSIGNAQSSTGLVTDAQNGEIWILSRVKHPLPVSLLYFKAQCSDYKGELTWATATETNNDFFTVQRSKDGTHFEDLANIPGAGNSNSIQTYQYIDYHPLNLSATYYRLKQTDYNGVSSYSKLVFLGNCDGQEGEVSMNAFFNSSSHTLTVVIDGYDGPAKIMLLDLMGRQLMAKSFKEYNAIDLNIGNLSTGVYLVVVQTEKKTFTRKLYLGR